jgi:hypothetical protein
VKIERHRRIRPDVRYAAVRVDNNFFDLSLEQTELAAAEKLLNLAERQAVSIATPHSVRRELDDPRTPAAVRARASRLPFTLDTGMGNQARLRLVQSVMRGKATDGRHDADAEHLYDAVLWQAAYFVTCDRRVLRKQAELAAIVDDLWVVRPSELLAFYDEDERLRPQFFMDGHDLT